MEWTILRIANDYSVNPKYKAHKLSRFFEDILGMDRSELLIRPCINSLLRLKLIEIDGYTSMALASDTVVSKIHLTDAGLDALRHNYIPGESKDTEECIYYKRKIQKVSSKENRHKKILRERVGFWLFARIITLLFTFIILKVKMESEY